MTKTINLLAVVCLLLLTKVYSAIGIEIGVSAKYQAAECNNHNIIDADLSSTEAITTTRISLLMKTSITSISFFIIPQKGKMIIFEEGNPNQKFVLEFDGKADYVRIALPKVDMKNVIFGWAPDEYGNKLLVKEIIMSTNNKDQLETYDRIHRLLYKKL